jgi:hypothetical protein
MTQGIDSNTKVQEACDALVASLSKIGNDDPLYLCIWGDGYTKPDSPILGIHRFDFFSQDFGYNDRDRKAIGNLTFGESVTITGLAETQSVVRVR